MKEFFLEYGMFALKTGTIVIALVIIVVAIISSVTRSRETRKDHLEIRKLNEQYRDTERVLKESMLSKGDIKQLEKSIKKAQKKEEKEGSQAEKRVFVINFEGDIKASAVSSLREEITAILMVATEKDEVFVKVHSGGGAVHTYGLAASQLSRIKDKGIPLVISVDKIAASGGYMMACVADKIIAAPFAVLGSIGVVAQIPNFNRLLKKHDIDYEMMTAGEYKRTLTVFGENTDKARAKFQEEIEDIHVLFKEFVKTNRDVVDIEAVGTGEFWFGKRALEHKLIDELKTSDDYLFEQSKSADIFEISYREHKDMRKRIGQFVQSLVEGRF